MEPLTQLPIVLPRRDSRSLLSAVHNQLRAAILDGRLKAGVRLPSTRAFAAAHGVSRNTAIAAYDLLLSGGYVSARRGSGTKVCASLPKPAKSRGSQGRSHSDRDLNPLWRDLPISAPYYAAMASRFPFQVGVPDPTRFPYDAWRRLSARIVRRMSTESPSFEPQGHRALREAIALHVSFSRAVACASDDVIVTAGAQQAFDILARVLTTPERTTVALEEPGYPPLRAAFEAHGARIASVPVDDEGLVVDRLPARARVVCVTPSHQFPLGAVMSARRRAALLAHCRRGAVIIEDDYDGEFRFVDRPLDALQTLDRSQSVFYVGTFSKSLLPDLRLGYIVAPPWALGALVAAKVVCDGQLNSMTQATLALLIREGHLTRYVRKMQRIYRRRRQLLIEGLKTSFGRWLEVLPSVAGLHVAVRLKAGCDEESIRNRARELDVGVGGLRPYYAGRRRLQGLVLGYGAIGESAIVEGLARLRRAMPPTMEAPDDGPHAASAATVR